jgi:GTP pyrophosphokinase
MEELNRMHQELLQALRSSGRDYDVEKIDLAYLFANEAHKDQKRLSGEPYMIHPVAVANQLVDLGMDSESVIAGLLHDVVEDTPVELAEIRAKFGKEVANLIDGLTKIEKIPFASREEEQAENVRKMLIAMAGDIRVIIIKLADRVHNMSTMQFQTPQKQRDKSQIKQQKHPPLFCVVLHIQVGKEEIQPNAQKRSNGLDQDIAEGIFTEVRCAGNQNDSVPGG